jgi:hypothetical protein
MATHGAKPDPGLALLAQDPETNQLLTYLTVPIRGATGKTLGWLAGSIEDGSVRRLLNTQLLGLG